MISLKSKFLLFFLLILVFPFSLFMAFSLRKAEEAARQDFQRRLEYAANLFRTTLSDLMDNLRARVKIMADFDFYSASKEGFNTSSIRPLLQDRVTRLGLDYLALIKDSSQIMVEEGDFPHTNLSKILSALCHTPLSKNLLVLNNEPWILTAAEITKLRHDQRVHVLAAVRLPRNFADPLKSLTGADFSLLYANKRILTTKMDRGASRMLESVPDLPDASSGETEVLGKKYIFVRQDVLPGQISDTIRLEISLPQSDFIALGKSLHRDLLIFGGVGIILALLTGSLLYLDVGIPIRKLAEITTRVAEGDFNIDLTSTRSDEIGLLYRNFSAMLRSLQQERDQKNRRMFELNTLFEISNAVNFINDSDELLKFLLTHAVEVLNAERGSIMLLDDQTDELVLRVAIGGRYRLFSSTPIKLGYGICGLVAKEGKGRICNAGYRDADFRDFGSLLPVEDIKTLLCSPLKFKEGTIGVINIVNKRDGQEFTESDLSLLNLIATQAAVTIENTKLYHLSITDGLTRLYVHRYFMARLSEELLRARRYGLKLSLIMIDIDNFKQFNDIYGHQVGDQVLQRVAMTIRNEIRAGIDVACRYGGEEFAIILPETRSEEAFRTAERIREAIAAQTLSHPLGNLHITASLGIASYPSDAHDRDSLVMAADKAMYNSKQQGKNRTTAARGDVS